MPEIKIRGLRGLRGLSDLSSEEQNAFIIANADKLEAYRNPRQRKQAANILYMNQKFINKFGIDAFNQMDNGTEDAFNKRNEALFNMVVDEEANKRYKNKDIDNRFYQLSPEGKYQVLQSDYLTPTEFEKSWQNRLKKAKQSADIIDRNSFSLPDSHGFGVLPSSNTDVLRNVYEDEAFKQSAKERNQRIFDKIYNDDVEKEAKNLNTQVAQTYWSFTNKSDNEILKAFIQAITPGSYKDKEGMLNRGIPEYKSHYGYGADNDISSEMKDFSIDDMRQVLAKKQVYDAYMSPDMAATALNNEAKRYIKEHQGSLKRLGLFSKDVAISAMSYTADKINGITELGRAAQDALSEKPIVMVDDRGTILDPNKVHVTRDRQGNLHYQDNEGTMHSVHQERVDYTTLHNMGKNPDGSDIEGAFGVDWLTLNPQYWTRAEQFGTLDENEQKQYEKLGSSPYKVAYNPNEDSDLWYEAFKMMSFGIADTMSQLVPFGIGSLGKALSTASKVGKVARGFGKALDTTGKLLTAETKVGQVAQGTAGALGIAYAYNRGAFQETLQKNLADAEEAVVDVSKKDIYNQYNTDKRYKAQVDRLINAKAASLKSAYMMQMRKDGGMQMADEEAVDKLLHAKAQDAVLGELVQNRIKERMSSDEYADLQQKAIDSAGDAAFNTFWPEALKYGFVNTMGYRKYLYTNPSGLTKKVSSSLKGLKEVTTEAGKKRLSTEPSKFLTRKDKLYGFSKTLGSQAWGGAWTNGTDDMQVDAAERINEDSYDRYLKAYRNGEALADVYGFADGLYSYMKGLNNSMGQETTWNSALAGGLGSVVNVTPHFANIARLATREGREAYRNNFRREIERDEKGMPLRNEDGTIKYKELGKWNDWRGQLNYFIQNGVLNTYYGEKQSERDLQSHADYVNNLLDQYNDFVDIEKLVASNTASEDTENAGDKKTMNFISALHAINTLNNLGRNSNDPTVMSSVIQDAKEHLQQLSKLNDVDLDKGEELPISEEETSNLLAQYYAANPGESQSDYNDRKALKMMAYNAQKLQEASEALDNAEEEIQKIERNQRITVAPGVRTELKLQQALNGHWTERKEKMQSEIEDPSTDDKPQDANVIIATIGGKKRAKQLVTVYGKQRADIEEQLIKQQKETEVLLQKKKAADKALMEANEQGDSGAILKAEQEAKAAKAAYENAKEQEKYINDLAEMTNEKMHTLQESIDAIESAEKESKEDNKERVLTADEIFALDPVTRARMMKAENRDLYSNEQQREIESLEQRLLMKDADALQKIQDIGLLTQRIATNKDAYSRIAKNPVAAALEFENQRTLAAETAYQLINQKNAETFADYINQFDENVKGFSDATEDQRRQVVFKELRRLNSNLLDILQEDALLPQYSLEVTRAKEWSNVIADISAVISKSGKDATWKENIGKNIDAVIEKANNKEEIVASLEKVIDDVEDPVVAEDFDYILKGLAELGYQRDATVTENREQKKQREKERKRKEEEKAAAKKKAEEEKKRKEKEKKEKGEEIVVKGALEEVPLDLSDEDEGPEPEKKEEPKKEETKPLEINQLLEDGVKEGVAQGGSIWYRKEGDPRHIGQMTIEKRDNTITFSVDGDRVFLLAMPYEYTAMPETTEHNDEDIFEINSLVKKDGDWYFVGNFAGSKTKTQVKMNKNFDLENTVYNHRSVKTAELAAQGVDTGTSPLAVDNDYMQGESASLEKQYEETGNSDEVQMSDTNEDAAEANGIGQHSIDSNVTTLSGNGMSRYNYRLMEEDGILERKVGTREKDKMNSYFAWMDAAGIKLQNIIDHELSRITKRNPTVKVKFMAVKPDSNATNDVAMQSHLMLVVDYDDNINPDITSIHEESNGGVIESNGKKYLVIGVVGYGNKNAEKLALYDMLWNSNLQGGLKLKNRRKQFFDAHPQERFYVNEELSTEIVPMSQIPGYIARQTEADDHPEFRSVRELLSDESRNPYHRSFGRVAWGIQENSKFLVVRASIEDVMVPRNPNGNMGSAFVLMPASNGKLVPSYLKVLKYNEIREGALKDRIDNLLQNVTSPDYSRRLQAVIELLKIFHFDKEGDNILIKKSSNEVSLVHNGKVMKTFVLDNSFDRAQFMRAMSDMNPRVNVTAKVLRSEELLKDYDEAGALTTDAALFGTAGSSYSIYGLDSEGKMIKPEITNNSNLKPHNNSAFRDNRRQIVYKHQYYREANGEYSLNGEVITDEKVIKQLNYLKRIVDNELTPAQSKGIEDYYILSAGEHPEVIKVNRNTKEVIEASEEQAKKFVDAINEREAKKKREEMAQKALEAATSETLKSTEDVDLGLGDKEFEVDPETGEMVPTKTQAQPSKEEIDEEEGTETKATEKGNTTKEIKPVLREHSSSTQKFTDLVYVRKYGKRIRNLIRSKWSDAPKKLSELEAFLRSKDIEVDSIGTSEKDVEAWIKTMEDCR